LRALHGIALAPWLVLAACGYTFGSGLHQEGIRTVHLEVVGNETWRQRLEAELGAELARVLPVRTDLLPADRRAADACLQVVITDDHERTLVEGDRRNPVQEGAFEATVRVRLVRARDQAVIVDQEILDRTEFRDPIGEDLTSARVEMIAKLADKIALALQGRF
jgi:hypothetical protein